MVKSYRPGWIHLEIVDLPEINTMKIFVSMVSMVDIHAENLRIYLTNSASNTMRAEQMPDSVKTKTANVLNS